MFEAPATVLSRQLGEQFIAGSRRADAMVGFRPRAARLRGRRHRPGRAAAAPRRRPAAAPGTTAGVAALGRAGCGAGVRRSRSHRAVVASVRRPPIWRTTAVTSCSAPAPRRASRWPTSCRSSTRLRDRSARPGAVPVADQGARPRPAARRAGADRRGRARWATSRRAPTTATARPRCDDSPANGRAGSSPTPT